MINNQLTNFFRKTKTAGPTLEKPVDKKIAQPAPHVMVVEPKVPQDLNWELIERKLNAFDADATFGPTVGKFKQLNDDPPSILSLLGVTRSERFARAKKFGLNPPADLEELIMSKVAETPFLGQYYI